MAGRDPVDDIRGHEPWGAGRPTVGAASRPAARRGSPGPRGRPRPRDPSIRRRRGSRRRGGLPLPGAPGAAGRSRRPAAAAGTRTCPHGPSVPAAGSSRGRRRSRRRRGPSGSQAGDGFFVDGFRTRQRFGRHGGLWYAAGVGRAERTRALPVQSAILGLMADTHAHPEVRAGADAGSTTGSPRPALARGQAAGRPARPGHRRAGRPGAARPGRAMPACARSPSARRATRRPRRALPAELDSLDVGSGRGSGHGLQPLLPARQPGRGARQRAAPPRRPAGRTASPAEGTPDAAIDWLLERGWSGERHRRSCWAGCASRRS